LAANPSRQQAAQECSPVFDRNSSFAACVVPADAATAPSTNVILAPSTILLSSLLLIFRMPAWPSSFVFVAILIVAAVVKKRLRA